MSTTITALTLDATAKTAAGAQGYYAALNSTASYLAIAGGNNIVTIPNDGTDNFPTKSTASNGLGGQYQGLAFWESQTPDRLIFKSSTTLHWMNETVNGYVFSGDIITTGTGMTSLELDLLDKPGDAQHLADSGNGTTYIWGIDEGNYPNSPINPPQEYNMGGQFWQGVRYSPDGNYVACMNNSGSSLRILKRTGDSYAHLTVPANGNVLAGWCDFSSDSKQIAIGGQNAGQPGIRVYNIDTATDTVTLDPTTYGDTTKACTPLYCGTDGNVLMAFNRENTNHKAYSKVGSVLTEDPTVSFGSIPAVLYAQKAKARPEMIALAHPSPTGYGVYKVEISTAPVINASGFIGPLGHFDAELKRTAKVNANFVGPSSKASAILLNMGAEVIPETIHHTSGRMRLEGTSATFSDGPPTFSAIVASFTGPKGLFAARLTDHPEAEVSFVGPSSRFDAILYEGSMLNADFVGPSSRFDAELNVEVPLDIEAGFTGPSGVLAVQLQHFSVEANFVGPSSAFAASLLGNDGVWATFVGPFGELKAELENILPMEADFVGPFGGFDASLGEDFRTIEADFVGPFGAFAAELYTTEAIIAGFIGPSSYFVAELEKKEELGADFVGPKGKLDALITRGPRLDAFFRGPSPRFSAQLDEIFPSTEGEIDVTRKKRVTGIVASGDPNSTLTFILIQP